MLLDMIRQNRSCRRFHQDQAIEVATLEALVNLARLSASAANLQPLKYILACQAEKKRRHLRVPGLGRLSQGMARPGRG